jgi:hypothetical protein
MTQLHDRNPAISPAASGPDRHHGRRHHRACFQVIVGCWPATVPPGECFGELFHELRWDHVIPSYLVTGLTARSHAGSSVSAVCAMIFPWT